MSDIVPDDKDWTWVLDRPCPDCGFDAAAVPDLSAVAATIRENAAVWARTLTGPRVEERRRPDAWSTTEYAAHVRDVHRVFGERLRLMLTDDEPTFANWDQDAAAMEGRYDLESADVVAPALMEGAEAVAGVYDSVTDDALARRGLRSNGSEFTVATLARYHLHDVVHHLWDVRGDVTVAAYDARAAAYGEASATPHDGLRAVVTAFADAVGAGGRVLEIGSAGGRDALLLEDAGLSVRRTDVTPAFVDLLRAAGHDADVLDPLTDELTDVGGRPYDGVWANACLLHVARADLPTVLTRLAGATRVDGVLRLTLKEGDGEGWSTHGSIGSPRMFVYWRRDPLLAVLDAAGWHVREVTGSDGQRGERWLEVVATRRLGA